MTVPSPPVLQQLELMLGRRTFRSGARSATLLKFLVTETLEGRADRLKDYTLGAEALGRGDDFDPRTDPIARVEASRLRSRLELYYATEGAADPVIISLPKGGYVPQFRGRERAPSLPASPAATEAQARGWTSHPRLVAFGLAAAALLAISALQSDPEPAAEAPDISYFPTPATFDPTSLAISPDGQQLVVVGSERGIARLMRRRFTGAAWEPLAGTEGASLPFWSPDSTAIGFFARSWMRRVDLATGVVRPIAKIAVPSGASWSRDHTILFPIVPDGPLLKVPADGGTTQPATRLAERQTGHRAPHFLPDGRFLFYVAGHPDVRGTYLGSLENGNARLLVRSDGPAEYARGHLLYVEQGTLFARPFDPARPDPPGPARALAEGAEAIASDESSGVAAFSVSEQGTVVYRPGAGGKRQLVRVHRSGVEVGRIGEPESRGPYYPSLSPNRTRLAVQRSRNGNTDILVLDLQHAAAPVYVTEALTPEIAPVWASGDRLVYSARGKGPFDLFVASLTGGTPEVLLTTNHSKQGTDWSPGRNVLLFRSADSNMAWDVWALPLGGEAFPVVRTSGDDRDAQFEPVRGRFIVYRSDRDDVPNIYLQPFPSGVPQPVSRGGGVHPRWSPDGRTIYYIGLEGSLVAVPFTASSSRGTPTLGEPTTLFVAAVGHLQDIALPHYVVLNPDEFLLDRVVEEVPPPVTRMLNLLDGHNR
jgi:Tol biopolymer transport system component